MEYTSQFNSGNGINTFLVTGEVHRPKDSYELQALAVQDSSKYECRLFLIDMTQAKIITETLPAFQAANPQGELSDGLRKLRTAVLYERITEHEYFFETVAVNRGFILRVFDKRDEAVDWLVKNNSSDGARWVNPPNNGL